MNTLVSTYTRLADIRGYSKLNPIVFSIRESGYLFKLVYSEFEPRKSELPVNVLWLEHQTGILRRRSSFEPKGNFNFDWLEISPEVAFFEEQYYDVQPDEIRDLGFGPHSVVGNATVENEGLVRLLDYNANAVVVPDSDPRLDNPRKPLEHDHNDFPRTMIKIAPDFIGILDEAKHPVAGSVLFIKEQINGNMFSCEWRKPEFEEIEWSQPMLVSLNIDLVPGAVASDNSKFSLTCAASWTDRLDENAYVEWSLEENPYGITLSRSGTVNCPNLSEDITLSVTARKQDPFYKHFVEDTYVLTIENLFDQPIGVEIEGAASLYENTTEQYSYFILYESGARKVVSPKTVTSSMGSISAGTFTPGLVEDDTVAVLSIIVKEGSFTLTAEKDITVIKNSLEELNFIYQGSVVSNLNVDEGSNISLPSYQLVFKNGQTEVIGFSATDGLTVSDDQYLEDFTLSNIKFSNVISEQQLTFSNSITVRGDMVEADLIVTIKDVFPFVEELKLAGEEEVGPDVLSLSPMYKRSGVQAAPNVTFSLSAIVDGTESNLIQALDGMTYTVNWAFDQTTNVVKTNSASDDNSELVIQIDENNSSSLTEELNLVVTATVYIEDLDTTLQVSKSLKVLPFDLAKLVGPVFLSDDGGQISSDIYVNVNNDGDAGFNVNFWNIILVPEDEANFPITNLPLDAIRFTGGPSSYDLYKNFTQLEFSCDTHTVDVMTNKIGYNWRTTVWVRGISSGETFNLTTTDPRISKSFTQQFTVN